MSGGCAVVSSLRKNICWGFFFFFNHVFLLNANKPVGIFLFQIISGVFFPIRSAQRTRFQCRAAEEPGLRLGTRPPRSVPLPHGRGHRTAGGTARPGAPHGRVRTKRLLSGDFWQNGGSAECGCFSLFFVKNWSYPKIATNLSLRGKGIRKFHPAPPLVLF